MRIQGYGDLKLLNEVKSIFDNRIAYLEAEDGKFYFVLYHQDNKYTGKGYYYAMSPEDYDSVLCQGFLLTGDVWTTFRGEAVRSKTFNEDMADATDTLQVSTDIWGNISCEEGGNNGYRKIKDFEISLPVDTQINNLSRWELDKCTDARKHNCTFPALKEWYSDDVVYMGSGDLWL